MHFMERSAVEPHRLAAGYRIGPRTGPTLARGLGDAPATCSRAIRNIPAVREHTSELQSHVNLVCRLLLEKKNAPFSRNDWPRLSPPTPHINAIVFHNT